MSWKKRLAVGGTILGAATLAIHCINKAISFSATLSTELQSSLDMYMEWKFGKICYRKSGSGKPILLIHDLNVSRETYEWNKIVKTLSLTRTVYTIDLLGCGNSDKPNITYTSYLYVQLLTDFINQIIEDKTDVIASGQSASFVLATSKDNSELIDKIVLINPKSIKSLSKAPNKRSLVAGWLINTPVLGTLLYNIIHRRERLRKETHDLLSTYTDNLAISITNFSYESSHSHGGRSKHLFSSIIGNYLTSNVVHHLENSTNSIYILTGKDNETTNIAAEEYIEVLPSIEHLEINNTKELPQLEAPQEFLRHLSYFLDDIDE